MSRHIWIEYLPDRTPLVDRRLNEIKELRSKAQFALTVADHMERRLEWDVRQRWFDYEVALAKRLASGKDKEE
ncbi:MAG: hypothetical protein ACM31O_03870 [Bacteroidota bacterium]